MGQKKKGGVIKDTELSIGTVRNLSKLTLGDDGICMLPDITDCNVPAGKLKLAGRGLCESAGDPGAIGVPTLGDMYPGDAGADEDSCPVFSSGISNLFRGPPFGTSGVAGLSV